MIDRSTAQILFTKAIAYWPKRISVEERKIYENDRADYPTLTAVHDEIEDQINKQEDNYLLRHMDWALFTVLHAVAQYQNELYPEHLNFEAVFKVYEANLNTPDDDREP